MTKLLTQPPQGQVPTTLAEFNLIGGVDGKQTFYDISLVDGYNIPLGIVYLPAENTTWIPPNLTNCACIAHGRVGLVRLVGHGVRVVGVGGPGPRDRKSVV